MSQADDDDTIRMRPKRRPAWPLAGVLVALLGLAGAGGWFLLRPGPTPAPVAPPAPVAAVVPPPPQAGPPAPTFAVRAADEATILANQAEDLGIFRFTPNPAITVLDFPTLLRQGRTLNRVAALVEKAGLPRDRVLTDSELDAAIHAAGDTMESYYYGHDYAAADLRRFFALADRDHIPLRPEEEELRALLRQLGLLAPDAVGALISLPRETPQAGIDQAMRRSVLRHELSHGEFFTNPDYAAYAARFFNSLDPKSRDAFRAFLKSESYDPALENLTINETQAYLMHTGDPRLFSAASLGLTPQTLDTLRANFLLGMPAGWLRDCTPAPPRVTAEKTSAPAAAPAPAVPKGRGGRP